MSLRARSLLLLALLLPLPALLRAQERIEFDKVGYRLRSLGERQQVRARVVDGGRRPVPNRSIAYRTSDPSIAIVSAQGVVQSRRVGRTRVWAISGSDSTSALIMVDQWAAKFSFSPSPVNFDAIGAQVPLSIQLKDSVGNNIPGALAQRGVQCRPVDDKVATILANGRVQSKANGVTWIRCADRGISDSVRVEVRQRPTRVTIANKLGLSSKGTGEAFVLRMTAFDSKGDSIPGARGTWASLNPNMVSVDPVSGVARATAPGNARILAQIGDATDTLSVVITGVALAGADTSSANDGPKFRTPTLIISQLYPVVGDTIKADVKATDASGGNIANTDQYVIVTSLADTIMKPIGRNRFIALRDGTVKLVGRLAIDGAVVVETTTVSPRLRAAAGSTTAAATAAAARGRTFVRPTPDTSAKVNNARWVREKLQAIVDSGIGKESSGRTVAFEGIVAQAKMNNRLSPSLAESRTGLMYGGIVTGRPWRRLTVAGALRSGELTPVTNAGEPMSVTELDAQMAFWLAPSVGIGAGYMLRGESTELALQRWTAANVTAYYRGDYIGELVSTNLSVSFFPFAKFSGDSLKPSISSLGGDAGVDLHVGFLSAGIQYYFENFVFPAKTGTTVKRTDKFSTLRLRVGMKFGR